MASKFVIEEDGRECSQCLIFKSWDQYHYWSRSANGHRSACKDCTRKINNRRTLTRLRYYNYGLTQEKYDELFDFQRGLCGLCSKKLEKRRKITIDHNHDTGKIRGILCAGCNTGLGQFSDCVEGLQKAIKYLQNTPYEKMEKNSE